ncbi:hypothetical protein PVAP13_9KG245712 [Panicum virgatum]|uniref:Uncharacterized protein n=1 Tax=Panicum virgatum TaxID=38727 RepID=A0A8T0P5E0_PANVG|nr:hypothetical protein PVAP13_9KG245712 [Panicum virgatum]
MGLYPPQTHSIPRTNEVKIATRPYPSIQYHYPPQPAPLTMGNPPPHLSPPESLRWPCRLWPGSPVVLAVAGTGLAVAGTRPGRTSPRARPRSPQPARRARPPEARSDVRVAPPTRHWLRRRPRRALPSFARRCRPRAAVVRRRHLLCCVWPRRKT